MKTYYTDKANNARVAVADGVTFSDGRTRPQHSSVPKAELEAGGWRRVPKPKAASAAKRAAAAEVVDPLEQPLFETTTPEYIPLETKPAPTEPAPAGDPVHFPPASEPASSVPSSGFASSGPAPEGPAPAGFGPAPQPAPPPAPEPAPAGFGPAPAPSSGPAPQPSRPPAPAGGDASPAAARAPHDTSPAAPVVEHFGPGGAIVPTATGQAPQLAGAVCGNPDCARCKSVRLLCPVSGAPIRPRPDIDACDGISMGLLGLTSLGVAVWKGEKVSKPEPLEVRALSKHVQEIVWRHFGSVSEAEHWIGGLTRIAWFAMERMQEDGGSRRAKVGELAAQLGLTPDELGELINLAKERAARTTVAPEAQSEAA